MKGKGSKRGDASLEGGGCARLRHAWWAGWTRSLPLSLLLIFLCLPAISRLSFAAYPCDSFGYDDAKNIKHEYLHADYSVRCKGEEYQTIIRRSVLDRPSQSPYEVEPWGASLPTWGLAPPPLISRLHRV
jgi:hypothetical protein